MTALRTTSMESDKTLKSQCAKVRRAVGGYP
jgi:hypothetical protein